MGRIAVTLLGVLFLLGVGISPARGHAGHAVIPREAAVAKGLELVDLLVGRGKLDGSWKAAAVEGADVRLLDGIEQWHLVLRNDAEKDPSRRRLYLFLSYDGQFLAANFSGKTD